jgi:hypothetical protein
MKRSAPAPHCRIFHIFTIILQGLIRNTSVHVGIRAPVNRPKGDLRNDIRCGFEMIKARDLDSLGINGVVEEIKRRVGDSKVYISVDIDVLDPAFAPGKSARLRLKRACVNLSSNWHGRTRWLQYARASLYLGRSEWSTGNRCRCCRGSAYI